MEENNQKPDGVSENIKTIHTYTSDMADAVRTNEASVIKIALAEKEKRERESIYKKAEGTGVSKFFLVLGGVVLLVAGAIGIYFFIHKNNVINAPQPVIKDTETLISYDDKAYVDVTSTANQIDLTEAMKADVEKIEAPRSIKALFLTTTENNQPTLLPLQGFISLLKVTAPTALVRTFGDQYMVGTYASTSDSGQVTNSAVTEHLFLIFNIKDYNQAYASMLEWEKTMLGDMFIFFHIDVAGTRSTLFEKKWKDIIINNKDARILYDEDGKDVLYYIFPNRNNLIITDSQDAIKEISSRLLIKSVKPL